MSGDRKGKVLRVCGAQMAGPPGFNWCVRPPGHGGDCIRIGAGTDAFLEALIPVFSEKRTQP